MRRNQPNAQEGERLQRSQTGCEAGYRVAVLRSGAYPALYGPEGSGAWTISKNEIS